MTEDASDPRVERTRAHVLAHARQLVAEGGPAGFTYSALAKRARVTRQTLYRHWPSVDGLFADLVLERAVDDVDAAGEVFGPDATAAQTVTAFLRQLRASVDDPATAGPLMALVCHADFHEASRRAMIDVESGVRAALNRLLAPNEVELTADEYYRLAGPLMFRRFFARDPITDAFVDELVATWWDERARAVMP